MGLYRQCFHPRCQSPGHGADLLSNILLFVTIYPPCFNVFLSGRNQPRYTFNQDSAAIPEAAKLNLCGGMALVRICFSIVCQHCSHIYFKISHTKYLNKSLSTDIFSIFMLKSKINLRFLLEVFDQQLFGGVRSVD